MPDVAHPFHKCEKLVYSQLGVCLTALERGEQNFCLCSGVTTVQGAVMETVTWHFFLR